MEQKKLENPGKLPYKEFLYVWLITLCTTLPISSLFPFLYFMIRDLHVAKRVEDIGFYAGFVGSSLMLGRALTSVLWGMVADRYGRKPVVMIGIVSVIIFNTLFGLSTSYWMAIATRFLLGSLNGLLGPIRAYAIEVCQVEHQSLALSIVSTAWGIGLIIGPAIGGFLAQPADKFPDLFSRASFFGRFPYFLPCLCISLFACGVFIFCFWMPETLHSHTNEETFESLESSNGSDSKESNEKTNERPPESILKNWALISSIIVFCVFSLHDMAYTEIFSLWAESDRSFGGLSFSSEDVGSILSVTGISLLAFQLILYPPFERLLGPINSARVAAILSIPLLATFPFMTRLSGLGLKVTLNIASVLKNILSVTVTTGTFILQNNAVPQRQRGAANGLSMTAMSFFKAVAPAGAGIIFSWAQKRQTSYFLPGDYMVFFILNAVELLGLLMTFKPFLVYSGKQNTQSNA